jgi:hypothetical protein
MTLTDLVPSLALCQQLKVAGFPQDTALMWGMDYQETTTVFTHEYASDTFPDFKTFCAAPTAEEILEKLPLAYNRMFRSVIYSPCIGESEWIVRPKLGESNGDGRSTSLVLAAALAYLWWKEKP